MLIGLELQSTWSSLESSNHYIKQRHPQHNPYNKTRNHNNSPSINPAPSPTTMLPMTAFLLALIATLALIVYLHRNHSQLSTPRLYILYATTSITFSTTLYNIQAEPWAYLLGGAVLSLYIITRMFHRKYHKITLKGPREGSNRRARRRER